MAPKLMQALKFDGSSGGAPGLKLAKIPVPSPYKDEVLVKVEATSLNPVDWKSYKLKLLLNPFLPRKFPLVPATDAAGEVVKVGAEVKNFKPGDKVIAMTALTGGLGGGALAEYAVAKEIYTVHIPAEVSAVQGACLPIAALTAYTALTKSAKIILHKNSPLKNILITAASGGVGHYAVQLAKLGNNHVTATCGARNMNLVKSLGADEVIDYKTPEGESLKSPSGRKYDVIIHCTEARRGWSIFEENLSGNGVVVDLMPGFSDLIRYGLQRVVFSKKKLVLLFLTVVKEDLKCMVDLVKEGKIESVIDFSCSLSEGGDAWRKMITGHATGKIVVEQ